MMPLPDFSRQTQIADVLTAVDKHLTDIDQAILKYRSLKAGLVDDLLSGSFQVPNV
jgi:hypothetical protein